MILRDPSASSVSVCLELEVSHLREIMDFEDCFIWCSFLFAPLEMVLDRQIRGFRSFMLWSGNGRSIIHKLS